MKQNLTKLFIVGIFVAASYFGVKFSQAPQQAPNNNVKAVEIEPIKDYQQARDVFWRQLYPKGGATLYCNEGFTSSDRGGEINLEHVFPMAWVTWKLKCGDREQCRNNSALFNTIEADLHNIFASRKDINKIRRSRPFGMIPGERRNFGNCDFEIDAKKNLVEPRDAVRGDIARAMFYMAEKYGLDIHRRQYQILQQWHHQDPPSQEEKQRNGAIESLQGNRNTYIDSPLKSREVTR